MRVVYHPLLKALYNPEQEWLLNPFTTFDIPTEITVTQPGFITPRRGRGYQLDLYVRKEGLYPYLELRKLADFNGTSHETQVWLYEVWTDQGSDGHIAYEQVCWTLSGGPYGNPLGLYSIIFC